MRRAALVLAVWSACGYLAAGGLYAKMRAESSVTERRDRQDAWFCALYAAAGPIGLGAAVFITAGFQDGWKHPQLFGARPEYTP